MNPQAAALRLLAPRGHVRVAVNFGNAAIAYRDPVTGEPAGVGLDMANAMTEALSAGCRLIPYDAAGKVMEGLAADEWDVGLLAVDPVRAEKLAFTPAYVRISACFMVHAKSPIRRSEDVDRPGRVIAAGRGAAYELHLTRTLRHARLERYPTASEAFDRFATAPFDAAAGVRRVVRLYAQNRPHIRVLEDDFLDVDQALCVPRDRLHGLEPGLAWLESFVERMKRSGFIAESLRRHPPSDAVAAPPMPG